MSVVVIKNQNASYKIRTDVFDGRPHLIVPVVLIKQGVLNGSSGSVFYPDSEISRFPAAWNGRDVPVFHPDTALTPQVANTFVGRVWNVSFDEERHALVGEIWFDEEKLKNNASLYNSVTSGAPVEVSTGLFCDFDFTAGTYNGNSYYAVAKNIRPDHLAVLPGQIGACSYQDGCGIRNQESSNEDKVDPSTNVATQGEKIMEPDKECGCNDLVTQIIANAKTGFTNDDADALKKVDNAVLSKILANATKQEEQASEQNKEVLPVEEASQDVENACKTKKEQTMNAATESEKTPLQNASFDDLVKAASPEMQEMIQNGRQLYEKEKEQKINVILKNSKNSFSKEELEAMSFATLCRVADLSASSSFEGRATTTNAGGASESLPVPTFSK